MTMKKDYPYWDYSSKKEWLRITRKRWRIFRSMKSNVNMGCVYYPKEVYEWLNKFDEINKLMRQYYKNA